MMNKALLVDPTGDTLKWDHRNGMDSYPYPHNLSWGWQECPKCNQVVRALELGCDYYPAIVECECGAKVRCPGVEDRGRFSGLDRIIREAEGRSPIAPGEVPVNTSESVREEFESMNNTGIFG